MENNNVNNEEEKKKVTGEVVKQKNGNESDSGKVLGILSYLGILALIPFLSEKNNSFVVYHAKQGMNLFILEIIGSVAASILGGMLHMRGTLTSLVELAAFILSVIGIVYVCQGEKKELPVINSIKIIK